jgi:hypothetical protein
VRNLIEKLGIALSTGDQKSQITNKVDSGFDMQRDLSLRLEQARDILEKKWLIVG